MQDFEDNSLLFLRGSWLHAKMGIHLQLEAKNLGRSFTDLWVWGCSLACWYVYLNFLSLEERLLLIFMLALGRSEEAVNILGMRMMHLEAVFM